MTDKKIGPASDEQFTWTCKNGTEISLPPLGDMDPDMGAAEDLADAAGGDNPVIALGAQLKFLRASLPAEVGDKLRRIKASEFEAFMTAWTEHSGVSAGESPAS